MSAGCPQQNISFRKRMINKRRLSNESGQIELVMGLFLILFVAVILCVGIQIEIYRAASLYMEDALAASNLASALINVEEYGISHSIIINDPQSSFEIYKSALKENLGLNEEWESENKELFSGKIVIEKYIIYNVYGDNVEILKVDNEGNVSVESRGMKEAAAPNGVPIEATGVYSEISFPIKGLFGITVNARKGKLVDVVEN